MTNELAIDLSDVVYQWRGAASPVLSIPEWRVPKGKRIFLYGASGSGKSTLLNLLAGILLPQKGSCVIFGNNYSLMSGLDRDRFRAQHLGYIFQQFNLLGYLTVEANVLLAHSFAGTTLKGYSERLHQYFDQLGLDKALLTRKAQELSVGQQQRVAVARALINHPQMIIADEPTSALDSDSRNSFLELLLSCAEKQKSTVVFVSHDRSLGDHFDDRMDLSELNRVVESV